MSREIPYAWNPQPARPRAAVIASAAVAIQLTRPVNAVRASASAANGVSVTGSHIALL